MSEPFGGAYGVCQDVRIMPPTSGTGTWTRCRSADARISGFRQSEEAGLHIPVPSGHYKRHCDAKRTC
ncbi:hypothetical protein ACFRQM_11545 [Streptomyces sp. NPDC056831]|uniref:hypothetical protein n=1 Tax=Streptomyces sp. NPDC056831 TaxID=3345954 RepID=UPI0036B8C8E7